MQAKQAIEILPLGEGAARLLVGGETLDRLLAAGLIERRELDGKSVVAAIRLERERDTKRGRS